MAKIDSMVWLTRREMKELGVNLSSFVAYPKATAMDDEEPEPIEQWRVDTTDGSTGLPIDAALDLLPDDWPLDEEMSNGSKIKVKRFPDPNHEKAAPGQKKFMSDLLKATKEHFTVLAEAPTGSGKTVTALNTIGKLGRTAVVVVPSSYLAEQWHREAQTHLGLEPDEIGLVQGKTEDWNGKKIVVVVLHNLFLKTFEPEFYSYFGTAVFDEVHNLGAREFSRVMHCFNAVHKFGVSATPDRKDGCDVIFKNYFGEVHVLSKQEALPIDCYVTPFFHTWVPDYLKLCQSDVKAMKFLSTHNKRNAKLIKLALQLYDSGYTVLILSKFIDHVELLIDALIEAGVPPDEIGQFTGKRTVKGLKNRRPIKQTELDHVSKTSTIIVGTYSMMKEGVDIPRIDAGIEALPVADARQAIGRARRPYPDKPKPKWFTIKDTGKLETMIGLEFVYGYLRARLQGFKDVGVDIHYPKK